MVKPVLRELAGLCPPIPFKESWGLPDDIAQRLSTAWEETCRRVTQTGIAEELQATRDDYQTALLAYLKIFDGYFTVMSRFGGEVQNEQKLNGVQSNWDQLQKHYDSLFPRWQTIEDLEAILLERISLPNEQLKELAVKYPPPAAWYQEADDQLITNNSHS
jgi:hypothetical protein